MNWFRQQLVLLVLFAVLAGTAWVYWVRPAPPSNQPRGQDALDEKERATELEERRQALLWHHEQQQQVIHDLAAGRCTLLAAAGRFRALYQQDPVVDQVLRDTYPAPTEAERLCRWVIGYFQADQRDEPGMAEVAERLEKELREHLERRTLRLPEP